MAKVASKVALKDARPTSRWTRLWQSFQTGMKQSSFFSSRSSSGEPSTTSPSDPLAFPSFVASRRRHSLGPRKRTLTFKGGSTVEYSSSYGQKEDDDDDTQAVSCVVVDGDFGAIDVPDKDPSLHTTSIYGGEDGATGSRYAGSRSARTGRIWNGLRSCYESVWYFFDMRFPDKSKEKTYQKEQYHARRQLGLAASFFYVLMWVLMCALEPQPWSKFDYWGFIGIYGSLTIPLMPMIFFNLPYRVPWLWQIWIGLSTWSLPDLYVVAAALCNVLYNDGHCSPEADFIVYASAIGQPTLAIMALGQNRLVAAFGMIQFFVLFGGFFFGPDASRDIFRDVLYFLVYHIFIMISSFITERSSREHFELRDQLKLQYKATQRAQVMEKKASDLTKRFVSYIFHEVRVPLNTAMLSVQNLEGERLFDGFSEDQSDMVHGLTGSLSMMEKVLNDVLSFNRMESGTFTQAKAAFDFHKSMQLTVMSHSSPAHMKDIQFNTNLDPDIDQLQSLFLGDEMRLRQITSNLVSNSLKFTQPGGEVDLTTKLISNSANYGKDREDEKPESDVEAGDVVAEKNRQRGRRVVVRVEIKDNGVGLRQRDLLGDRLFSPYVQTELGRRQGGKGTGLGLALVRQIVQLSGGRLGVESLYGKGSTFWFELQYPLLPPSAEVDPDSGDGQMQTPRKALEGLSEDPEKRSIVLGSDRGLSAVGPVFRIPAPLATKDLATDESDRSDSATLLSGMTSPSRSDSHKASVADVYVEATAESPLEDKAESKMTTADILSDPAATPPTSTSKDKIGQPSSTASTQGVGDGQLMVMDVLVVDDDKLTRMMMSRMLKRLGHQVQTAENGQEALEKIKTTLDKGQDAPPIHIVFLDNQMPLMTGVEVASHVRELGSNLFIVGCTGNALKPDQDEYLEAGADRILTKPIKQKGVEECLVAARTRLQEEART